MYNNKTVLQALPILKRNILLKTIFICFILMIELICLLILAIYHSMKIAGKYLRILKDKKSVNKSSRFNDIIFKEKF